MPRLPVHIQYERTMRQTAPEPEHGNVSVREEIPGDPSAKRQFGSSARSHCYPFKMMVPGQPGCTPLPIYDLGWEKYPRTKEFNVMVRATTPDEDLPTPLPRKIRSISGISLAKSMPPAANSYDPAPPRHGHVTANSYSPMILMINAKQEHLWLALFTSLACTRSDAAHRRELT